MGGLAERMPIIAHSATGADCCGCLVVDVRERDAALRCNECGAIVGTMNAAILDAVFEHIAPERNIRVPAIDCPHCVYTNRFPGWDRMMAFICRNSY
jgi:hypothetical protein